MPSTQTVFRYNGNNKAIGAAQPREESIPQVTKHELLIKIRSVSLNYRDIGIANGKYPFPSKDDLVPCSDAAGDVVEVGEGVRGFEAGDKVVITFDVTNLYGPQRDWNNGHGGPIDGMLREYITVPASSVVKIPQSGKQQTYSEWSSLVCTGVTAWNALYGVNPMKPGAVVLLQGTGGVSITGLILAKAAGATTIITSSSDEKLAYVKEKFGVDHTINYKKNPNWGQKALEITNGRGVDYILENGGSGTIAQSITAIAFGGVISVIGFLAQADQSEMPDVAGLALSKGCVVRGVTVGSKQLLEEVVTYVANQGLRLPVEKEFGFTQEEVTKAFEYIISGQHIGKVCIRVA
ncbi:NAD(P)-binding protein [Aspergillus unguis]